jgi:hypothetical protein
MALARIARGGRDVQATLTEPGVEDLRLAVERLTTESMQREMDMASLQRQLDRVTAERDKARSALLDTADDIAAMTERSLPRLRPGMYADDPIPADGDVWTEVPGDRCELPALVGVGEE